MLNLLGFIFSKIIKARNSLYERGFFRVHPLGAPTISVGNITVGGTGKTPVVILIAKILSENGFKPCVLTRGYGRKSTKRVVVSDFDKILANTDEGGDEPVEIAKRFNGKIVVIADANRVAAAEFALDELKPTAFILDDGFQHRRAGRDINIALVDATNPFGNEKTLPAGILREPIEQLSRADAIIVTRAELSESAEELAESLKERFGKPTFVAKTAIHKLRNANSNEERECSDKELAYSFCGIGNPKSFFEGLERKNVKLAGKAAFRDHFSYAQQDVDEIVKAAKESGASYLVTTAKDAVKLDALTVNLPLYVAEIEVEIEPYSSFRSFLLTGPFRPPQ